MEQLTLIRPAGVGERGSAREPPPWGLTDEQERAVARRRGPLLLAAGAGSGKTSVLTERFVRAVHEDGVAPSRILAITFTERAAGELAERVGARLGQLGQRAAARAAEAAFVGTFHGFCACVLRTHAPAAGVDPEFKILDEGIAARLRRLAFAQALTELLAGEPSAAVDLLAAYGADRTRALVLGTYAELRSRGQRAPRLPRPEPAPAQAALALADTPDQEAIDRAGAAACALFGELLERFGEGYEELKRMRGAVDFDDLELCAGELLRERAEVRRAWAERFELLMVDEFQDTNPRQLQILEALERANLFTVGDELQAIYGFRHADVRLFRARRAALAPAGGSLALTHNFRGRAPLLDAVNAVFAGRFADYTPLRAGREDAEPPADRGGAREARAMEKGSGGEGALVELLLTDRRGWEECGEPLSEEALGAAGAPNGGAPPRWRQAEARLLAWRVAELVARGEARAGEIVVLLRALGDVAVYERALRARGLRTLASAGGFWGHQQVGDLLAYLRALANPLNELALYSTLASPLAGLSSDVLALLARAAGKDGVWETLRSAFVPLEGEHAGDLDVVEVSPSPFLHRLARADREALARFCAWFDRERRTASLRTISTLIERAIDRSGYERHVLGLEEGERRLANVRKLLALARRYEASEGRDLHGFLDYAAEQGAPGGVVEPDVPVADADGEAVRLMSIHAAKGLEFAVVCVADLGRAPNMSVPDLLVGEPTADAEAALGLRLLTLEDPEPRGALRFAELCERRREAQVEEEQRILYVAMTRAREKLLLSGAIDFHNWPEERAGVPPIGWLGRALLPDLPERARALEQPVAELTVAGTETKVRCWLNAPRAGGGPASGADVQLAADAHMRD
jgi:ATP-dependent helicase/nuclease subunit A